jgi:enoyl-CoA hydratase
MSAESHATNQECLAVAFDGPVATLTLQQGAMNAIDDVLLDELAAAFAIVEAHSEVSVLRIRSERRVFSAGADLRLVAGRLESAIGADEMRATVRRFHEVYDQLAALPLVTIAEIEGHALGGGLELALACDIRIASHTAKLGLPETKVGLLPGAGGTQRLTRLCGEGIAARIILSGDVVGGREAERIGLVQWAFAAADFNRSAAEIVSRTANLSANARKIAKNCIRLAVHEQARGAQAEIEGIWTLMHSAETKKRVHGFLRN